MQGAQAAYRNYLCMPVSPPEWMASVGQQSQLPSLLSPWRRGVSCPFPPTHAWRMGQRSRWCICNTQDLPPAAEWSRDGCCLEGKQERGPSGMSAEQHAWHRISHLLSTLWPPDGPSLSPQVCQAAIWACWASCCLISPSPRGSRQMDLPLADG